MSDKLLSSMSKEDLIELVRKQEELINEIEHENYVLNIRLNELIQKYEAKNETVKKEIFEKFCPKSEKLKEEIVEPEEIELTLSKPRSRRSPSKIFLEELKKVAEPIIIDYDFEGNGVDRDKVKEFGEDVTYKIEFVPSNFKVKEIRRKKYKDKDRIYEMISDDPFPHSYLTPSLAANICEMKFSLGVPLDRYSKYLNTIGLSMSPQNLSNYVYKTGELLRPLFNKMKTDLINNKTRVIHADETTLEVLDIKDRINSYIFVYASSFYDVPIYIYEFNETRAMDKTKEYLKGYEGYLISDAYSGYDSIKGEKIKLQKCFVHCRRMFNDAYKVLPEAEKKTSVSSKVLKKMSQIFKKEAMFKEKGFTPDKIKERRNKKDYQILIDDLDSYIRSLDPIKGTLLYKAVNYYKNNCDEFWTIKEDGHIDISNNLCERAVKVFALDRRNFLFCKTSLGAEYCGIILSVLQSAKANGLKSEEYLKYVLENINKETIDNLVPYSNKIPVNLKISSEL